MSINTNFADGAIDSSQVREEIFLELCLNTHLHTVKDRDIK